MGHGCGPGTRQAALTQDCLLLHTPADFAGPKDMCLTIQEPCTCSSVSLPSRHACRHLPSSVLHRSQPRHFTGLQYSEFQNSHTHKSVSKSKRKKKKKRKGNGRPPEKRESAGSRAPWNGPMTLSDSTVTGSEVPYTV